MFGDDEGDLIGDNVALAHRIVNLIAVSFLFHLRRLAHTILYPSEGQETR